MAKIEYHNCPNCEEVLPHNIKTPPHAFFGVVTLLLIVLTFFVWLLLPFLIGWILLWILFIMLTDRTPRCAGCGMSPRQAYKTAKKEWKAGQRELKQLEAEEEAELGPAVGKKVVVKRGRMKGVKGTVVERRDGRIVLADKRGRQKEFGASQF